MRKIKKKYKLKLQVLTPVFIDKKDDLAPVEIHLDRDKKKIYPVDVYQLVRDLAFKGVKFVDILEENCLSPRKIETIVGKPLENYLIKDKVWEVDEEIVGRRSRPFRLSLFIKDANNNHFIPGSTLKGLFHTLFYFQDSEKKLTRKKYINKIGPNFGFTDVYFDNYVVKIIKITRSSLSKFVEAIVSGKGQGELVFYQDFEFSLDDIIKMNRNYLAKVKKYGSFVTRANIKKIEELQASFDSDNEVKEKSIFAPIGMGKGFEFSVISPDRKFLVFKEILGLIDRINHISNNSRHKKKLIKRKNELTSLFGFKRTMNRKVLSIIRKYEKGLISKESIRKEEIINSFPATAWKYKGLPLGWVKLSFSS